MEPAVRVANQFRFAPPDSATACMPISLLAIFHQYDVRLSEPDGRLQEWEWGVVMDHGTKLWRLWHDALPPHKRACRFPTVHEVLALPVCSNFVRVFGDAPIEYAGMVRDTEGIDNPEGSLEHMLCDMVNQLLEKGKQREAVCCLLVLPNAVSVSMLCLRRGQRGDGYEIRYFDSHGCRDHDYVDFAVFDDYRRLLAHLLSRYRLPRMDTHDLASLNARNDLLTLQTMYGYSAMLFCK